MGKGEQIEVEKEKIEKIKLSINKSVKYIEPVDTTGVVLKNAPPTKEYLDKYQRSKSH